MESQTHKLGIAGLDVTYQMLFGMERESEAGSYLLKKVRVQGL